MNPRPRRKRSAAKRSKPYRGLVRLVSGGQTGVDRAALDGAIATDLEHGGWCPKGRLAEDGVIPTKYRLRESAAAEYAVRTEQNVVDSDGTLILTRGEISGGTELTRKLALRHGRPVLVVDLVDTSRDSVAIPEICGWLAQNEIEVLNVAGPRESSSPGISDVARNFVESLLSFAPR